MGLIVLRAAMHTPHASTRRYQPEGTRMPKANLGDLEIYYESHGEGPPLLLVPGLGGVGSYWNPNIPALSANYRVIIHDHRGLGQSSRSMIQYSVDQMTDDLLRLLDHLGIDRAHLVGHSTGGAIGQTLAVTHPERLASMIIYASWTRADPFFRRVFEARRTLLTASGTAAYVRSTPVFLYPDWWINENLALLEEREKLTIPNFPAPEIVASRIDAIVAFDRTADLARITTPTLVLVARDDFLTPPYFSEELARLIPNASLRVLDKGGHCASETAIDDFNAAVLEFVDGQR
ncbi:MAG: pyrimidine utilization protein D [Burkholderiales bacterium]|nr:MAG: pyrimidine utilization protein D [Burkholderiales bacterium]